MTYKFVTQEEIENLDKEAALLGNLQLQMVPLYVLLDAIKVCVRIFVEREAYRDVAINLGGHEENINAEAARIMKGKK